MNKIIKMVTELQTLEEFKAGCLKLKTALDKYEKPVLYRYWQSPIMQNEEATPVPPDIKHDLMKAIEHRINHIDVRIVQINNTLNNLEDKVND